MNKDNQIEKTDNCVGKNRVEIDSKRLNLYTGLLYTYKTLRFSSLGSVNKNIVEKSFIINIAEYTGSVRNLFFDGDPLRKKTTCLWLLCTRAQILSKFIQKNLSARGGGTLNFKGYWMKK